MAIVAFDIGGSAVKVGIWVRDTLETQPKFTTPTTWSALKEAMRQHLQEFSKTYVIEGVALSSPGSVDVVAGVVGGISAVPYLHDFSLVQELSDFLKCPVSIENDAHCAALAEVWQGVAQGETNVLGVVVGTGIGGAVIVDGEIQRGNQGFAGEFGCMLLNAEGTFSRLATPVHMAERYEAKLQLPAHSITGEEVFQRAQAGDVTAQVEVETFYNYLAQGLYNLQFTLDPAMIVLGGSVSRYEPLIPELRKRLQSLLERNGLEYLTINLQAGKFLAESNLVGAVAAYHMQREEPKPR